MQFTLYLPESFNYEEHEHGFYLALLLHTITFKYVSDSRYEWGDEVSLKFEYLKEIIPSSILKEILTYAEGAGLICINNHYVVGGRCRKYSLGYEFLDDQIKHVKIEDIKMKSTLDRIQTFKRRRERNNFTTIDKYIMNCVEARVDYSRMLNLTPENLIYFAAISREKKKTKDREEHHQIERMKMLFDSIKRGEHIGVKDKNGRLHTTISSIQGPMKHLLTMDGYPIVFQDISHTHLVLLWAMINGCAYKIHTSEDQTKQENTTTLLMNQDIREDELRQELKKFKEKVEKAELYGEVASDLGLPLSMVKTQLLSFLYDHPRSNCKYTNWFLNNYPLIYDFILHYKKHDHRFLGNFLQQNEVEIVLNRVCYNLMLEYPGIPLITIHDCIGTTPQYKDIVKSKLESEFERFGVCPKIKEQTNV